MPNKSTIQSARIAKRQGKSPSTQAGSFVREEIHHVREGKHGARSAKQAIAIGLSKARKAGVKIAKKPAGKKTAKKKMGSISARRGRASLKALRREPKSTVSTSALSRQGRMSSQKRGAAARSASARKGARTRAHGR